MKDNPYAFPMPDNAQWGMTLRDYFAGQALAGLLANPDYTGLIAVSANDAYQFADAMLAEREKEVTA